MITMNTDRIVRRIDFKGKTGLVVSSMFRTIQGEGPLTGRTSVFLRLSGCNFGDKSDHCKFCFPADKKFLTASGKRKFKDVKVGDKLWALDENGNLTTTVVQKVMTRDVTQDQIVNLDISIDGVVTRLTCTDEHPIHTSNRGFVAAKDLRASDRIVHVKPGEIASLKRRDQMLSNNPVFDPEVAAFKSNGANLVSKSFGLESSEGRYANEDGTVTVVNYSCAPYNTFIVDNIHTHNCDTSFELDNGTHYELSDLLDKLTRLPGYYPGDALVITGGEPTLQANLLEFCKCAKPYFDTIQIETNGTQAYFFDQVPSSIITVVSPKPSHKLGGYAPLSPTVLAKASCLKFVISADPNSIHHEVPEWGLSASRPTWSPTYVSPMAEYKQPYAGEVSSIWDDSLIDREATAWNYAYAAAYTMRHNLRLSLQTHLFTAVP